MHRAILAAGLTVLLLAGCAAAGDMMGVGSASPGEVVVPAGPAYPSDQVVLQVAHGGGFRMVDRVSNEIPDVTLWGDGRVVFAAPDGSVREGRLAPETVSRLVGRATFLYDLKDDYAAVAHTDAPTATFTVFTNQGRKTVAVYGLDPQQPAENEPHPAVFAQLRELWALVFSALPGDAPELVPSAVQILTFDTDSPATVEWPSDLSGRVLGEKARRAAELAGLGEGRTFLINGKAQRVLVVPVLPQPGAWDEAMAEPSEQLNGRAEDDTLSLEALAQREPDGGYAVKVTVRNKTEQGVDLLYDCGTQLFWEGLRSAAQGEGNRVCPAVYSSRLEPGQTEELETTLAPDAVADWDALSVAVRYHQTGDGGAVTSHVLTAKLAPATP